MKKIKVTIEEHIVQSFEIEADSIEEAMELAENKYKNGDIVLESGEVHTRLMNAEDPETYDVTEWKEF